MEYKLVYARKREVTTARKAVVLLFGLDGGAGYSLSPDAFTLAELFDGERSNEEVMDLFYQRHDIRLQKEKLDAFIVELEKAGFLHKLVPTSELSEFPSHSDPLAPDPGGEAEDDGDSKPADPPSVAAAQPIAPASSPEWPAESAAALVPSPARPAPLELEPEAPVERAQLSDRRAGGVGDTLPGVPPAAARADTLLLRSLPLGGLVPLGKLLSVPAKSSLLCWATGLLAVVSIYLLASRVAELLPDLSLSLDLATQAASLVLSALAVNFVVQLARAAACHGQVGTKPVFQLRRVLVVLPKIDLDLSCLPSLPIHQQRRAVMAASIFTASLLTTLSTGLWLSGLVSQPLVTLVAGHVALLSGLLLLFLLNPLTKSDGYHLLAARLSAADLRERAFLSLYGAPRSPRSGQGSRESRFALSLYWGLSILFVVGVSTLIVLAGGFDLALRWQAAGVAVYLALQGFSLLAPLQQAESKAAALRRAEGRPPSTGRLARGMRRMRSALVIAVVVVVVMLVGRLPYTYEPSGDFIILPVQRADVRALTAGDIREIFVQEGDTVEKGELLARLAGDEERTQVAVSESRIDLSRAKLSIAEQGATDEAVALAQQKVETATTRYKFSLERAARAKELFGKNVFSQQQYDNSLQDAEVDAERLKEASRNLELLQSGSRPEEIEAIEAEIAKEQAELAYHEQQLAYSELRATTSGQIVSGTLRYAVGEYLSRGELLVTIENTDTILAEINVPEVDIGEVKVGSAVRIKPWAFPGRDFKGEVLKIAPNAEDSDHGKVVRVLTQIENSDGLLKSELTGYAKIEGETQSTFAVFTRMLKRFVEIEFWSWLP